MGGNTSQAPTGYQPAQQAQADQSFQTGAQSLANTGSQLSGAVDPAFQQITNNVTNNPYYTSAMAGATTAANTANTQVAPQQLASASQLQGLSQGAGSLAQTNSQIPLSYTGITSNPELMAGLQTLATAYDPQQTLYNQQYQQQMDQQNAINAMNGVAGSPYAAGVSGQANQNFNTNWQNNQLQRQVTGLSAYDSAASTAAQNITALTGASTNNYSTLANTAGTTATDASNLGIAGLNTQASAAQLPYDLYNQQQQAELAALGSQVQGTNAAAATTQQSVADQGTYLGIGQQANSNAIQATQADNQAAQASSAGFGNLFGSLTHMFSFTPISL
jgi:hypothetical protein